MLVVCVCVNFGVNDDVVVVCGSSEPAKTQLVGMLSDLSAGFHEQDQIRKWSRASNDLALMVTGTSIIGYPNWVACCKKP